MSAPEGIIGWATGPTYFYGASEIVDEQASQELAPTYWVSGPYFENASTILEETAILRWTPSYLEDASAILKENDSQFWVTGPYFEDAFAILNE